MEFARYKMFIIIIIIIIIIIDPSIKFACTLLHPGQLVDRNTVRVKCLSQERNAKSLGRAWSRTTQSQKPVQ